MNTLKKKENNIKIIASLTSYGERVRTVHLAIETILNQTLKADKVILWLAEDEFNKNNIPDTLRKLEAQGLTIGFCKDTKSYKKLVPTLQEHPDDIIITFDDDIYYKSDVIEKLYNSYLQEPKSIHCIRGHKINFETLDKVAPYSKWDKQWYQKKSSFFIIPTGGGGVLYPPQSLHVDTCKDFIFMDIAPTSDDLWFKTMSLAKGTKCKVLTNQTGYSNNLSIIENTQNANLWDINKSENDKAVYKLFDKYKLYKAFNRGCINEERLEQFRSILDNLAPNLLVENESYKQLMDEYLEKKIEREISKYNDEKEFFWDIALFFRENGYLEYEQKSLNRYFAHKAVEFRDMLALVSESEAKEKYSQFYNMFKESKAKQVFQHYIFTHALLNKVDVVKNIAESSFELTKYLQEIGWVNKIFLYNKLVKDVIKLNMEETKSSVVIISNGYESYILDTLEEIVRQKKDDYKIIFVSNNETNQTKKVLSFVDTFIQMRGNSGAYLARNIGSIFAFSEILIFLEDDGIPEKKFVSMHQKLHSRCKNLISIRGACLTKTATDMHPRYWLGREIIPYPPSLEGNCSFKAKDFYRIGGWGDDIMFGGGGYEICHRFSLAGSKIEQHIYSPEPILYHDYFKEGKNITKKKLIQHASWQVQKFSYTDLHEIFKKWNIKL
jgi:GT2 family glycosyltransferase